MAESTKGIEGIVLAAGFSRRAGRFKMSLALGDRTVIQRAVESMLPFAQRIHVVVGWQADRIAQLLEGYDRVATVLNPEYPRGMFTSVQIGVMRIKAPRFFLLPGDMAMVSGRVYGALLAKQGAVVIPTFGKRRGHPVLISQALIPEIRDAPEGTTLRDVIRNHEAVLVEVDDQAILYDIDTPEDYEAALQRMDHGGDKT
jgi:molybdenum cofactor cytidylyltransferase